jgi:hypothetical protein
MAPAFGAAQVLWQVGGQEILAGAARLPRDKSG